jgi:hypothetical protein
MNLLACCGEPFEKLDDEPAFELLLFVVLNFEDKNDLALPLGAVPFEPFKLEADAAAPPLLLPPL